MGAALDGHRAYAGQIIITTFMKTAGMSLGDYIPGVRNDGPMKMEGAQVAIIEITITPGMLIILELRKYKNNSDQFERIPRLNLPHFFNHRMSHAWANQHVFFGM